MKSNWATIQEALGGVPSPEAADIVVAGVSTDSRTELTDRLFFALTGPRFDGHDFVADALAKGAAAAVVSRQWWLNHPDAAHLPRERILAVADPLQALGQLAHWWRQRWGGQVVAITGSAGKTTTKELLAAALRAALGQQAVWATPGNWNNAVGVPLTLLGVAEHHRFAVVEVAMNQPGEIAALGRLVAPNIAVVLNALRAHLAGLGSIAAIAAEKGSLVTTLAAEGVAVLPLDSPYFAEWQRLAARQRLVTFGQSPQADIRLLATETTPRGLSVTVARNGQPFTVHLPRWGDHLGSLVAAALAVLTVWEIPWEAAAQAWTDLPAVPGRLQRLVTAQGTVVLDDTYNANPDAMKAAIDTLLTQKARRYFVVMGEMAELGQVSRELHEEVAAYARQKGVDRLFALGSADAQAAAAAFGSGGAFFPSAEALLAELLPQVDGQTALLVKGSRISRMERIVAALLAQGG